LLDVPSTTEKDKFIRAFRIAHSSLAWVDSCHEEWIKTGFGKDSSGREIEGLDNYGILGNAVKQIYLELERSLIDTVKKRRRNGELTEKILDKYDDSLEYWRQILSHGGPYRGFYGPEKELLSFYRILKQGGCIVG